MIHGWEKERERRLQQRTRLTILILPNVILGHDIYIKSTRSNNQQAFAPGRFFLIFHLSGSDSRMALWLNVNVVNIWQQNAALVLCLSAGEQTPNWSQDEMPGGFICPFEEDLLSSTLAVHIMLDLKGAVQPKIKSMLPFTCSPVAQLVLC